MESADRRVAEAQKLPQPGEFELPALIADCHPLLRRYATQFKGAFKFRSIVETFMPA